MPLLKPAELAELKKLAGADLDAALMAAVRLGMKWSDDADESIKRAAELLESDARKMEKQAIASGSSAHAIFQVFDERKRVAKALRVLVEGKE